MPSSRSQPRSDRRGWTWREWCLALGIQLLLVILADLAGADLPWWFWVTFAVSVCVTVDVAQALERRRRRNVPAGR